MIASAYAMMSERSPAIVSDDVALRQLRHQTKNALQRILCQIHRAQELQTTPQGQHLVSDLERRVWLCSVVSDALFAVISNPGPLRDRLRTLTDAVVELMGDPRQHITTTVAVDCHVPERLHGSVLRIAHEFIGNAMKHGMRGRSDGMITVRVIQMSNTAVQLQVLDDGAGPGSASEPGEGSRIAAALARTHLGHVTLEKRNGLTVAEAVLRPR